MKVLLLGTGSADGWPSPFCACPSCEAGRATRDVRGHTAALVDGEILLDCGPEVPRAAERFGAPLHRVRFVLLTHAHADHAARAPMLWRSWVVGSQDPRDRTPLEVAGPAEALAAFTDWARGDDDVSVRTTPLAPGDVLERRGRRDCYTVRALAAEHTDPVAGPGLLYDVAGAGGGRLLYATDTGPLPEPTVAACRGAAYDLVLLEETFGERHDHGTRHLDLRTFPRQLERLRSVGAVTDRTTVVPVHLGHHNPPGPSLAAAMRSWGATLMPDGAVVDIPGASGITPRRHGAAAAGRRRILVTGGVRSGKSVFAESLPAPGETVTYVATAAPSTDPDWSHRLAVHRARRPPAWGTVELGSAGELVALLRDARGSDVVLVDDLGNWLARIAEECGAWDERPPRIDGTVPEWCARLVEAWGGSAARLLVAVTNEVGDGVVPSHRSGRLFRDWIGRLNTDMAAASDDVVLVTVGVPTYLRRGTQ